MDNTKVVGKVILSMVMEKSVLWLELYLKERGKEGERMAEGFGK